MATLTGAIKRRDRTLRNRMAEVVAEVVYEAQAHHSAITTPWKNRPDWRVMLYRDPLVIGGRLVAADEKSKIWRYVDEGTGSGRPGGHPYLIFPRRAPALRFRTGYSARTQPIARYGVGTGQAYGQWVRKPFVLHPGIERRQFTFTFAEEQRRTFRARVLRALSR